MAWDTNGCRKEIPGNGCQQNPASLKNFQEAERGDLLEGLGIEEQKRHMRDEWEARLYEKRRQQEELINKIEFIGYSKDKAEVKIWGKKYEIPRTNEIRDVLENTEHFVDKRYVEILNETGFTPEELEFIIRYVLNVRYDPFKKEEYQQNPSKYFFPTYSPRFDDKRSKAEMLMYLSE